MGIRQLRAEAALVVRNAEAGQPTVITVRGRAVAQIGPVDSGNSALTIDELIARGMIIPPRRGGPPADAVIPVWGTVRLDRLLAEVRG